MIYSDRMQPIKVRNVQFESISKRVSNNEKSSCILEAEISAGDRSPFKKTFENEMLMNNPDFQTNFEDLQVNYQS